MKTRSQYVLTEGSEVQVCCPGTNTTTKSNLLHYPSKTKLHTCGSILLRENKVAGSNPKS